MPFWDNAGQYIHYNVCDRWIPEDRNYILKREETEDFKEFYKKSLRFRDDRRMFIALERFNLAYEKKRFEDNIIDYVIAFEALFGTMQNHFGMEIELKAGFLIEDSKEEITKIYKFMRDVYDLRSSIVHGDENKEINKRVYLFSWDNATGSDRKRILRFLRDDLNIGWVDDDVEIRKDDDSKTISIIKDKNSAKIMVSPKKKKAIIETSNGITYGLKVNEEYGRLNIYEEYYYSDYQLRSDIIKIFGEIIKACFDEKSRRDKEETFTIIEDALKSDENKNNGEEIIESILDEVERKRKLRGQAE